MKKIKPTKATKIESKIYNILETIEMPIEKRTKIENLVDELWELTWKKDEKEN
jgi:hypothetical protein